MLKFGLDWSWVDLNYSKYTISESEEPGSGSVGDIMDETIDIGNHQLEYGMQVGPSITINPVHELKISLYFRLTPSYSMMYLDDSFNSNFALFYSFGGSVAWKVISVGVEGRWGQAKYNGFSLEDADLEGISSTKTKQNHLLLSKMIVQIYPGFLKQFTHFIKFRVLSGMCFTNPIKQLENLRSLITDITMMELQNVIY